MALKIGVVGTGKVARRNYLPCLAVEEDVSLGCFNRTAAKAAETAAEGIRCNTIHPGLIDTNMQRQSSVDNPEEYVKLNAAVPMGYMGPPHTIADAALFLVSDLSTYMTGAQMVIDGGLINQ